MGWVGGREMAYGVLETVHAAQNDGALLGVSGTDLIRPSITFERE